MTKEKISYSQFTDFLKKVYFERDTELQKKYSRSLPFQDAMFDRWERAKNLGFGNGSSVYNSVTIFGNVSVGEKTWIGPNVLLDGGGGEINIGSTCSIASGVQIYTHDSIAWALSGGELGYRKGSVHIGSCTYIGSQCVIAAGTNIGSHSVIGANSFVNTDVDEYTIVGGSPARRLGKVEFQNNFPVLVFDNGSIINIAE